MTAHVLVVDDNMQNRMLVQAQLGAAGYRVSTVGSGVEAIATCLGEPIDLVLLDVMMPGIDGFETCRRMRELPSGNELPIVFLTALNDQDTHRQALGVGADDFLSKPINRTELLIRVRSLIRVAALHRELRSERDELLRVQAQKEVLTTHLIHDLKNPLASIISNGDYVLAGKDIAGDSRDAVHDMLLSAGAMHQMVMNLLDISLAEDGALVPTYVDVDVRAMLEGVYHQTRRRVDAAQQVLKISIEEEELLLLRADPSLLTRVLENLVDNSIRYAPRQTTIEVVASRIDDMLQLRIRDEGRGVPVAARDRLFEKYADGERDRSSRGLGLFFCKLAIEAHGGRISVEDNVPRGATFCVSLPLTERR